MSDETQKVLFRPLRLGAFQLPHRIVMAPMTRLRADADFAPESSVDMYYAQRAGAALIISESIMVAPHGDGYGSLPGIYSDVQRRGWQRVVSAVHERGGTMLAQLATLGRARFARKAGPSSPAWAIEAPLRPHEFATSEVEELVDQFARAAAHAREAGFDGIEIHNGNGYLLDQFLRSGANRRDDRYGGTRENRFRLAFEILAAVREYWPAERIGIRLSPSATIAGAPDPEAAQTFSALLHELSTQQLAYVHITRPTAAERARGASVTVDQALLRKAFTGAMIMAGDFDREEAARAIAHGMTDAVAFARLFVANPDLPDRFRNDVPLAELDASTLYTGGPRGYIDYAPH